ncbi:MAG: hypothetical protein IMX00_04250 [Limnochordales bacterium]|nr:hypothetical protein [Limnochordales bacterium]
MADGVRDTLERRRAAIYALLQNWSGYLEAYAKSHASWTDRTGHARQGLHAGVEVRGSSMVLYLSHGVEYGEWLEIACKPKRLRKALWNKPGPYAIVEPTMQAHERRIRKTIEELWRK